MLITPFTPDAIALAGFTTGAHQEQVCMEADECRAEYLHEHPDGPILEEHDNAMANYQYHTHQLNKVEAWLDRIALCDWLRTPTGPEYSFEPGALQS